MGKPLPRDRTQTVVFFQCALFDILPYSLWMFSDFVTLPPG